MCAAALYWGLPARIANCPLAGLAKFYQIDCDAIILDQWHCPSCTGICRCAACTRGSRSSRTSPVMPPHYATQPDDVTGPSVFPVLQSPSIAPAPGPGMLFELPTIGSNPLDQFSATFASEDGALASAGSRIGSAKTAGHIRAADVCSTGGAPASDGQMPVKRGRLEHEHAFALSGGLGQEAMQQQLH